GGGLGQCRGNRLARRGVEGGARFVDLGRGPVRLGQGDVAAQRLPDRQCQVGKPVDAEADDDRVRGVPGENGQGRHSGGDEGAGDVDALARGLGPGGQRPLHGPARQGSGEFDGAVEAGVGGEGGDHAMTTSTSASSRAAASALPGAVSVTRVSTWSRPAKRRRVSWPSLLESARTTTRRAQATIADFTAASSGSGVLSPKPAWMPLAPTKAMSGRRERNWSMVDVPMAALVSARTRPPMTSSWNDPARAMR